MPHKIFISYRRQDSGANALGIGQYLEHEFGRKNVFIDVDMRAGSKFPAVLEERLAECKVLLVLIGSDWLNSKDDEGRRRLDNPDDWVRLEIARALKRDITVIPVRVNGAELPAKASLPVDIRGLLDHQATSVTLAGFRNEMAGLVRDIRSIPGGGSWRSIAIGAALAVLLVTIGGLLYSVDAASKAQELFSLLTGSRNNRDAFRSGAPGVAATEPGEKLIGTYEGIGHVAYALNNKETSYWKKIGRKLLRIEFGPESEYQISISLKQSGSKVSVYYRASTGGEGEGTGTLVGDAVEAVLLRSMTPSCPGSYTAIFKLSGDTLNWNYEGQDCGGVLQGYGQAKKIKA